MAHDRTVERSFPAIRIEKIIPWHPTLNFVSIRRLPQMSAHVTFNENASPEHRPSSSFSASFHNLQTPPCPPGSDSSSAYMVHNHGSPPDRYSTSNEKPPISVNTLSELDLDNISTNLLLRHDLNFDLTICYRPSARGIQGERKDAEMAKYWNDVRTELAAWLLEKDLSLDCFPSDCQCPTHMQRDRGSGQMRLVRLRQIFRTLVDILKTLLHADECLGIDLWIDNDLRQELENDACDFLFLNGCMSALQRRHCSSDMHCLIDLMTTKIHDGVRHLNGETIIDSLKQMFGILEIMKLVRLFQDLSRFTVANALARSNMQINTFEFTDPQWWTAQSRWSSRILYNE